MIRSLNYKITTIAILFSTLALPLSNQSLSAGVLNTPNSIFAKKLLAKHCRFGSGGNHHDGSYIHKSAEKFKIRSISRGAEGWWKISYIFEDYWDHFLINKEKTLVFCGERNFRDKGYNFRKSKGEISDKALVTYWQSGYKTTSLNSKNKSICREALDIVHIKWDADTASAEAVKTAQRNTLTPQRCAKILGRALTPASSPIITKNRNSPSVNDIQERLEALKSLVNKGLITEGEAANKRKEIIDEL